MLNKLLYHTPSDEDGNRRKFEKGPNKGKELPIELHALAHIDAVHAVRNFPGEWSYSLPEGVDEKDVVDKRVKTPVFNDTGDEAPAPAGPPIATGDDVRPAMKTRGAKTTGDID